VPPMIRLAGLFVAAALMAASCTNSPHEPSLPAHSSTPASSSAPPVSSSSGLGARTTSVETFQLASRSFGVVTVRRCLATDPSRCRQRLLATEDFGRTWTDITPMQTVPGGLPPELALLHASFVDPEHGWVTANDCAGGKAVLFSTASGGRRWARTSIPPSTCNAGAGTSPTFVDARHGWLVHLEPTGESASLQRSNDGGRTWSRERDFPWITGVRFVGPLHGWLGGRNLRGGAGLFRTEDGGRMWTHVSTPLPSCCRNWIALFDAPTFFDDEHAVAPVTLVRGNRSMIAFDVTSDGGHTWRVAAKLPQTRAGASGFPSLAPVSIATPSDWWALAGSPPVLHRTNDGGRTWRSIAIPTAHRAIALDAVDGRHAWITVLDGRLATLLATRDGGRTWRGLTPVARTNRPPASTAPRTILPLPGPVTAVAPGEGGIVYAAYLPHPNGNRQSIVRFDPATGAVERSPRIPADRAAWIDGRTRADHSGHRPAPRPLAPGGSCTSSTHAPSTCASDSGCPVRPGRSRPSPPASGRRREEARRAP
jgi:photosystem II stability/assembly factor-like uncharacterized protein